MQTFQQDEVMLILKDEAPQKISYVQLSFKNNELISVLNMFNKT